MHELSIAQSLLEIVLNEAENHRVSRVDKVGISIGRHRGVVASSLLFSFDLIKEGTKAHNAELIITELDKKGVCNSCGQGLDFSDLLAKCPHCDSTDITMTEGAELTIDYIEAE